MHIEDESVTSVQYEELSSVQNKFTLFKISVNEIYSRAN